MSRILYCAPFFNIPVFDGASRRATELAIQLAKEHEIVLMTYQNRDSNAVLEWGKRRGIPIHFLAPPQRERNSNILRRAFAAYPPGFSSHNAHSITETIQAVCTKDGSFDALFFATQLFGQAMICATWQERLLIDLYDVYTPLAQKRYKSTSFKRPYHWLYRLEAWRVRRYEKRILEKSDLIFTTSKPDRIVANQLVTDKPVHIIPNGTSIPDKPGTVSKRHVLFVGNFNYEPNVAGVRWFFEQVWPLVIEVIPDVIWTIVGSGNKALAFISSDQTNIQIAGRVASLDEYYADTGCAIIPIFDGGGTRLKLLEAMAWAVPTVSTTKGAEGIEHEGTVLIADTPKAFAESIINCLRNTETAREKGQDAREVVSRSYSWHVIGQKLLAVLNE